MVVVGLIVEVGEEHEEGFEAEELGEVIEIPHDATGALQKLKLAVDFEEVVDLVAWVELETDKEQGVDKREPERGYFMVGKELDG